MFWFMWCFVSEICFISVLLGGGCRLIGELHDVMNHDMLEVKKHGVIRKSARGRLMAQL